MELPSIQIDWDYFKSLDEIYCDDLEHFGIIILTFVKNEEPQFAMYDKVEKKWALLRE